MDIRAIKTILEIEEWDDELKKKAILNVIASDDKSVTLLSEIIQMRFERDQDLINELNLNLSRAATFIHGNSQAERSFVMDRLESFYSNHRKRLKDCFNLFNFEEADD